MSAQPLAGMKIIDLTRVLAGPISAQMLADLGAEVIKIERPGTGDDARAFGPPYLVDPEGKQNNNAFYLCANRGKKSVTVNIAGSEVQTIVSELAKSADVMMENYKVGDLTRYGLDYESIKGTPIKHYRAPPLLYENTREVLSSSLGYDEAKLDDLKRLGII